MPPYDATRSRGCGRPASSCSARPTWTSSRWARRPRTRAFGPTRNPWDTNRIPGGSGGGSAAAVAPRRGAAGASAPTPAARSASPPRVTGTVGVKPTYGTVSPIRPGGVRVVAGPGRAVRAHRARRRAAARGDRRARPARLHLGGRARAGGGRGRTQGAAGVARRARSASSSELLRQGYQPGVVAAFDAAVER